MSITSSIIKTAIDLNQKLSLEWRNPVEQQSHQLKQLLEKASQTAFGIYYGFDEILKSEDIVAAYRASVPICSYKEMNERWWHQQQKQSDITWPGKPDFFALSSGTTGKKSKRIPVTDDFLQSIRDVGTSLIRELPNFDFPKELYETEILMLSSSANLQQHEGHFEGEISGINVSNFPGWYDLFYRPGKEIAMIDNWDERIERIIEEAPNWNIGAIAGIPSWVLLMLNQIVEKHNLNTIHEIWPNLSVYASGGVAFETYRAGFERICKSPLTIIDTYLASEGFFAYSSKPDSLDMKLALSHGYFYEFVPFDHRGVDEAGQLLKKPEVHGLDQIEENQEYVLVVSSCAGAWRYVIGDVVKFTSVENHEIKITGRTKFFLNVVGSQLSEEKMDTAIVDLANALQVDIAEYIVGAMKDENEDYYHQWIIVSDDAFDEKLSCEKLDQLLSAANKNYRVARSKALKGIKVTRVTKAEYHQYLESSKKKGGQVKTPKVMKQGKLQSFLDFVGI